MQAPMAAGGGINQMLELFKMQYLMKFMDSSGGKSGSASMITMFILLAYDQFVKYAPQLIHLIWVWAAIKFGLGNKEKDKKTEPLLLMTTPPPPQNKTVRAFIQFERNPDKSADSRIDAVVHHVCNLPDVRSLRYNGVEMIPNFKDSIMIENDVWFEIINPSSTPTMSFGSGPQSKAAQVEPILYRLSTYDHDITWLHKFVDNSIERFEQEKKNKLGSETYYFDQIVADNFRNPYGKSIPVFTKSKFTSNRTLDNVYLRQINELKQRVGFFMRRRDWYDSKGIPHTLGIVMYGVPGCGKTSTIKGIANETKRHIFNIALSEIKTKEALKDLFYNEQVQILQDSKTEVLNIPLKHRLYVIEDIDAMNSVVIKRSEEEIQKEKEHKLRVEAEMELLKQQQGESMARSMMKGKTDEDKDKLDLATLLNVLDGVRETPGRIIILSTNYPERLDEALLRPGRFDMMVEFEKHSCEVLKLHLEKHYDVELSKDQLKKINDPSLNKKWTPAEVSQILFRRVADVDGAIDDLVKEDPKKLFKFSQFKGEPSVEEKGTLLDDLLETPDVESPPPVIVETNSLAVVEPSVDDTKSNVAELDTTVKDDTIHDAKTLENISREMKSRIYTDEDSVANDVNSTLGKLACSKDDSLKKIGTDELLLHVANQLKNGKISETVFDKINDKYFVDNVKELQANKLNGFAHTTRDIIFDNLALDLEKEKEKSNYIWHNSNQDLTFESKINLEKEKDDDDFDDYFPMSGGGISMGLDGPSREQLDAENHVRSILFNKKIDLQTMLASPMFQNNDGFTAMNSFDFSPFESTVPSESTETLETFFQEP
jgi:hypothetical protein